MKLTLLYPFAIASLLFASSCDRSEASYQQPVCKTPINQQRFVDWVDPNDKAWDSYGISSYDWSMMRYRGAPFTDLCTIKKNSVYASIVGSFTEVKAFVKFTSRDSMEIPLSKVQSDAKNFTWSGTLDGIDLQPYSRHYPGMMWPVVYVKMNYDSPYKDHYYQTEVLMKNLKNLLIKPTGQTF